MKRIISISIFLIVTIGLLIGCKSSKTDKTESINLYYNKNIVQELDSVKELAKSYEEESGQKINFIAVEDEKDMENFIGEKKEAALVLLNRYSFIDFVNRDFIRNLSYLYKDEEIKEDFSILSNLYGSYQGEYYGLGLMPYSLQLVYNEKNLKKMGVDFTENNMIEAFKKLNDKKIRIPVHIKSPYSKEILITTLIGNDTITYDLTESEVSSEVSDKIKDIINGQIIFDKLNEYYKNNIIREENFIDSGEEIFKKFNAGEIPVVLTTTLCSDKLTTKSGNYVIDKMPINNTVNAPVGIDSIIASTIGDSKTDDVDNFIRYLLHDGAFEKLAKKNKVSGNKKADSNLKGVQDEMTYSINNADAVNRLYINIISKDKIKIIDNEAKKVMSGKYDGKEWSRISGK